MDDAAARRKVKQYTKDASGFVAFCKECVCVMSGDSEIGTMAVPFKLWPEQERFARLLWDERRIIALKARQLGMTTEVLAFFLYRALFWFDQDFRIVSINETDAKDSLERVKFMIANLPEWCRPELEISNTSTVKIAETGSVIRAIASTKNAGRGKTLNGLLMDEDAAQVYAEMILKAASPALEKRNGWLVRLSTANGVGNSFEKSWRKAEQGIGYKPIFLNWRADPSRDDEWYQRELERNEGDTQLMAQEFPENPTQAFLASGRPFFNMEKISSDLAKELPYGATGYLDGNVFVKQARGVLKVYKFPVPKRRYVIGSDVAEGLEKGDWSTAIVRDADTLEQMARVRCRISPAELSDVLWMLGHWYCREYVDEWLSVVRDPALLAVEANNHGIACTSELQRRGYRRLFYMRDLVTQVVSDRAGWLTTGNSRRLALSNFQSAYRTGRAEVIDREELEEMGNFFHRGATGKPQAGVGCFDDLVMADAICITVAGMEATQEDEPEAVGAGARYWAAKDAEKLAAAEGESLNGGLEEMGG